MKLKFEKNDRDYDVFNKRRELLGNISFHDDWKCWVWEQEPHTVMSSGCLTQVINFLEGKEDV